MINIALADDHIMLRNGLAALLKDSGFHIVLEANNGAVLLEKLKTSVQPHVILLDINMPQMDGYQTALWLKANKPEIKVLALSMYDDEAAVIQMLKNGARGYVLKDGEPKELIAAIHAVLEKGYYYSEMVTGKLIHTLNNMNEVNTAPISGITDRELHFLKLTCTEMTYKEIADEMHLSPRTVDGYRDVLFEKLGVKSRVGLVLFAIKNNLIQL